MATVMSSQLKIVQLYFATTAGRDKFYRAIQYFCRFLVQHSTGINQDKLKSIVSNASVTRKWLRLVRLDFFNPLVEEIEKPSKLKRTDPVLHYLTVIRNISMQLFFYCDHAILFQSLKLYNPTKDTLQNIKTFQMRFWAAGLILSIFKQIHSTNSYPRKQLDGEQSFAAKMKETKTLLMDIFDLMIPLTSLGYTHFSESAVGIFGTITALNGVNEVLRKTM